MSDETLSLASSRKGNNRRCIKINSKKIQRICAEMDLQRCQSAKIKEQAKIMGSFCILMYDLQTDNLHKMKAQDQAVIREQMSAQSKRKQRVASNPDFGCFDQQSQPRTNCTSFEQVDSIRFLKTNVGFYERAILIWTKFKLLNDHRIQTAPKSQQFALIQEFTQFLKGFLCQTPETWSEQKNDKMLGQAIELIASIILQ